VVDHRGTVAHDATETEIVCRFLWVCTGYFRHDHGYVPELPGQDGFGGRLVHPQAWPTDLDVDGLDVVVLGSGATAVTLVPALVDLGARVTMVQRSPSYVASVPRLDPLLARFGTRGRVRLLRAVARWRGIGVQTVLYALSRRAPGLVRAFLLRRLTRSLPAGYDVGTHFTPRYDPWDQRLCVTVDGGLFTAISSGRAEVVTGTVERLTPTGVRMASGRELPADVVVTATGLELLGLGGLELVVDGRALDLTDSLLYRGVLLAGVPNCALTLGHSVASWTLRAEVVARFVTRLLRTMRRRGLASVTPEPPTGPEHRRPLLAVRAGYVLRGAARLPSQGSRYPWVLGQNPVRERLSFALRRRTTGLRFVRAHETSGAPR
jgi:monooxygenase